MDEVGILNNERISKIEEAAISITLMFLFSIILNNAIFTLKSLLYFILIIYVISCKVTNLL